MQLVSGLVESPQGKHGMEGAETDAEQQQQLRNVQLLAQHLKSFSEFVTLSWRAPPSPVLT